MSWNGLCQRNFPRVNFPCLVTARCGEVACNIILTHTMNIGVGGVCVSIKEPLSRQTMVSIEIDLMDGGDTIRCTGRVVWSIEKKMMDSRQGEIYDVGIEFEILSSEDTVRIESLVRNLMRKES